MEHMEKFSMKTILIIVTGAAIFLMAFNNPGVDFGKDAEGGIQFYKGTWEEALKTAKKENKIVFLDIYATWCGPCKLLKSKTFSNKEVGAFYNQTFLNVSLDGETGDGLTLANKYHISGYPTLLFINSEGKIVGSAMGYHKVKEFLQLGKNVPTQK